MQLKKGQNKIRSFNRSWYVINGKKGIRGKLFNTIYWYVKSSNKYMRKYDEKKESSYPK